MNRLDEIRAWRDKRRAHFSDSPMPFVERDMDELLRIIDAAAALLGDAPCQCISADDMCGCCRALRILRGET